MTVIEYNVRDDWPDDEPTWTKSLVSSFYRPLRKGARLPPTATTLPLTVATQEVVDWIEIASGEEAWAKRANRNSLMTDIRQSEGVVGTRLARSVSEEVEALLDALVRLGQSGRDVNGDRILHHHPGSRTDPAWAAVETTARKLLGTLASDAAVEAAWEDLVELARTSALEHREHTAVANTLFDQLRLRSLEPEAVFRDVVEMLAYGRSPSDDPRYEVAMPPEDRLAAAKAIVLSIPDDERVVVWLGYLGGRVDYVKAGNVTFMDAHWYVPNASADRHDFIGKEELAEILRGPLFSVAERVDEQSDVDILARVDLGSTKVAGAEERAEAIVDALLSLSVHWAGGVRPFRTQAVLLRDGKVSASSMRSAPTTLADDHYGANITNNAIANHAPRLGSAMAAAVLPRYLAAAVEAQTAADSPFSREKLLQPLTDADVRGAIPLEDRVVQHVAAHARLAPNELFELLTDLWPHSRWAADVQTAVGICLLGGGPRHERIDQLRGKLYATNEKNPWLVFVADHEQELLRLCRVMSERSWVARMLRSVSDPAEYLALIHEYRRDAQVLHDRRTRVRNALVHGNPVAMAAVYSVTDFASFLSRYALQTGLDSFVTEEPLKAILSRDRTEQYEFRAGTSVAEHWRARAARTRTSSDSL